MIRTRFPGMVLLSLLLTGPVPAQFDPQALVEKERVRSTYDEILEEYFKPVDTGKERHETLFRLVDRLEEAGPQMVPLLIDELDRMHLSTFAFAAIGLSRFDGDPAVIEALYLAADRADGVPGQNGWEMKAWSCWSLALLGDPSAVDRLNRGTHQAGSFKIHHHMSVLESVAILTHPESVEPLIRMVREYSGAGEGAGEAEGEEAEPDPELRWALRALGRTRDPRAIDTLGKLMRNPYENVRIETAIALRQFRDERAQEILRVALTDPSELVRSRAAEGLNDQRAALPVEQIVERLETENHTATRNELYSMLARISGENALRTLRDHRDRPDPIDRLYVVHALRETGSRKAIPLLVEAMRDHDDRVALAAIRHLTDLGGRSAVNALTEALRFGTQNRIVGAAQALAELGETRGAPLIVENLKQAFALPQLETRIWSVITLLTDSLIELDPDAAVTLLGEAFERHIPPSLEAPLRQRIEHIEIRKRCGDQVSCWRKQLQSEEARHRELAYEGLAAIRDEEARKTLLSQFGRVEPTEGAQILRALGDHDSPETRELVSRLLLSPQFDPARYHEMRNEAGWLARRFGGSEMFDLLAEAIERRDGREAPLLIYATLLDRERGRALIERHRESRLRYLGFLRADEYRRLGWVLEQLDAGLPIDDWDVPPSEMNFRYVE